MSLVGEERRRGVDWKRVMYYEYNVTTNHGRHRIRASVFSEALDVLQSTHHVLRLLVVKCLDGRCS